MPLTRILNLIDGQLTPPTNNQWLSSVNPATGQPHAECPNSADDDIDSAIRAARAAQPTWARMPDLDRAKKLNRLADLIDRDAATLAEDESNDNGKPLSLASDVDIPRAAKNLRFFASIASGFASESHAMPDGINYTLRQPVGVAGCISPWNLPLYLLTWKIAPALVTGNCVVAKPSEITPLTAFRFSQLTIEAGLPQGVLNVVHGAGATTGAALIDHHDVDVYSFTGGTVTGRHIASQLAPRFKKLSLELGGKNPNLVFDDCHYEQALATTVRSSFANQGQICLCGSRIFIQRRLYAKFRDDLVARAQQLRVGDPLEADTQVGAVVSEAHLQKISAYVDLARQEGGTILCGGRSVAPTGRCEQGFFYAPTIIEGLPNQCRTNQEEIFGPVVTLIPFDTEHEAVAMANDIPYGLSATIWSENVSRAHRVAAQMDAGVVWVNCWLIRDLRTPFGGMKQSGLGREGGLEALRFFTEPKNVCVYFG